MRERKRVGDPTTCEECGEGFERGEKVVMLTTHPFYLYVFFHEKCYREAYNIPSDEKVTVKTRSEWLREWRKLNPRGLMRLRDWW